MRRLGVLIVLIVLVVPSIAYASVNDPYYSLQWGLQSIGGPTAWNVSKGAGQTVAVIDTGVDYKHPDLRGRLLTGHDFVDDDSDATDTNGHGTLISGIIAAATNNGIGVASIAPQAHILPVRVLGSDGTGQASNVAKGIDWAMAHGAGVINLSIAQESGTDTSKLLLQNSSVIAAINSAATQGAVVVIAAGNDPKGAQSTTAYDATTSGVVVVGASTKDRKPAAYSNYGAGLDLLAPGGGSSTNPASSACSDTNSIVSAWWDPDTKHSTYGGGCGTSMAVAFVSGVAAMLRARGYTNAEAVSRILHTADNLGAAGRDNRTGYGILNAARALGGSAPKPKPKSTPAPAPKVEATRKVTAAGAPAKPRTTPTPTPSVEPSLRTPQDTVVSASPEKVASPKQAWSYSLAAGLIVIVLLMHAARRRSKRTDG
jgi:subtilisin family serine protease